jgi:uncharacterized protein (DUF3084 family)
MDFSTFVFQFQLQSWADQLKMNALLLELSRKYIPEGEQEQLKEDLDKAIVRNRELAARTMQKAEELEEIGVSD